MKAIDYKIFEQQIENFLGNESNNSKNKSYIVNNMFGEENQNKRFEKAKKIATLRKSVSM